MLYSSVGTFKKAFQYIVEVSNGFNRDLFRVADQNVVVSAFLVAKMRYVLSIIDNMVLLLVGTKPGSLFVKKSSVQKSQIHIDNRNDGYVAVDKLCFG